MTQREMRRLRRADLLELLITLSKENEQLQAELEEAKKQLAQRKIMIENAGSIAEAALRLNGVFEAAQAAADQYLESLHHVTTAGLSNVFGTVQAAADQKLGDLRQTNEDGANEKDEEAGTSLS